MLWRENQIEAINRLLKILPSELKLHDSVEMTRRSLMQQIEADPSEAVRSLIIPDLLREYFDIEYEQACGGTILHPMYPLLNHNRLIQTDPITQSILKLLLEYEEMLIKTHTLESDFRFYIGRVRKT